MDQSASDGYVLITRGEKVSYLIRLRDESGDPVDLNAYDEFKVCHEGDDGSAVVASQTAVGDTVVVVDGDPLIGRLKVTLSEASTALLKVDELQDIDIELDNSGSPGARRRRLKRVLTVEDSICG